MADRKLGPFAQHEWHSCIAHSAVSYCAVIQIRSSMQCRQNQGGQVNPSTERKTSAIRFSAATLKPDVTFLGFTLSDLKHWANTAPAFGWFFVIQQQPTEPRFGMDEAKFDKPGIAVKTADVE